MILFKENKRVLKTTVVFMFPFSYKFFEIHINYHSEGKKCDKNGYASETNHS